jgi:hypothetical protein
MLPAKEGGKRGRRFFDAGVLHAGEIEQRLIVNRDRGVKGVAGEQRKASLPRTL